MSAANDVGPEDIRSIQKIMEVWVDSDSKVRLLVFFRQNPGLIETLEGLAQRLAIPPERLGQEIQAHLQLGLLKERAISGKHVYFFDRKRWGELEALVEGALKLRRGDASS